MQQLVSMSQNQTMTSKELVEVINAIRKEEGNDVEIQHSDLMRRIKGFEQILAAGSVAGDEYLGSNGQLRPMLLLNKEACLLTVSSESPRVNLAIIRRWQALEQQQQAALPQTRIEAVRAYLETLEQLELVEQLAANQAVVVAQQAVIITDKRNITNEGKDYFTVAAVKPLNQGMKLSGSKLSREADDQELPPIKQHSMYGVNTPYAYHRDIWEAVYPEIELPD